MELITVAPPAPQPEEERPKRKHVMTEARLAAAKANAAKSCGPHDTSKTRLNGLVHGCCSELPIVMPGEDPQALQDRLDLYINELGARTQAERDALEVSVLNYHRFKRADRADTAAETRVVEDVKNNFDDRQLTRLDALVANLAASPVATILELRRFTRGITWCLEQLEQLDLHLETHPALNPGQLLLAIYLSARRPQNLFIDDLVMKWNLRNLSAQYGPGKLSAASAAGFLYKARPEGMTRAEFEYYLGERLGEMVSVEEGQTFLLDSLDELRAGLLRRFDEVKERETIDEERAVEEAAVSVNADCMKRLRYRRETQRAQESAMRLFHQLKAQRLKHGEEPVEPAAEEADASETGAKAEPAAAPGASEPAGEAVHRTEAAATQVSDGIGSNDDVFSTAGGSELAAVARDDRDHPEPGVRPPSEPGFELKRE
jgi:hypothetical protein